MVLSGLSLKGDSRFTERQIFRRINRLAETTHFKMKLDFAGIGVAHLGDLLSARDALPFFHQHFIVMRVSTEISLIVLDDDQLAITAQPAAAIYHLAGCAGQNRLPELACDIDALAICLLYTSDAADDLLCVD